MNAISSLVSNYAGELLEAIEIHCKDLFKVEQMELKYELYSILIPAARGVLKKIPEQHSALLCEALGNNMLGHWLSMRESGRRFEDRIFV